MTPKNGQLMKTKTLADPEKFVGFRRTPYTTVIIKSTLSVYRVGITNAIREFHTELPKYYFAL